MAFQMTKVLLLSLLLCLVACSSKEKKVKSQQAALYYGAGTQALMSREYTEALTNLMKANELAPDDSNILTNLAMAYYFKGQKDLALTSLNAAIKANKDNSDAKVNLASLYYEMGRIDEAEKLYKLVLKDLTYDKQARTYYNLALIELEAKKNHREAQNYLALAIKEDPNYCAAHMKLGLIQYDRRQFKQALATFKEGTLGTCYDLPAPHYYQALSLTELGRFPEAKRKFEEVSQRFRSDVYAVKARTKLVELQEYMSRQQTTELRAPRKVFETPAF